MKFIVFSLYIAILTTGYQPLIVKQLTNSQKPKTQQPAAPPPDSLQTAVSSNFLFLDKKPAQKKGNTLNFDEEGILLFDRTGGRIRI